MTRRPAERFELGPGLALELRGRPADLRHFRAEYGPGRPPGDGPADLVVRFEAGDSGRAPTIRGGHKTVRWAAHLSDPDGEPLTMTVVLGGRPQRFARSLVQGYLVEPLLAVAAARRDCVLLPAAALDQDGRALVLLGGSGVGKTTLSARAAAGGIRPLGDDQVIVDESGTCWPFPRRLRLYPDLKLTAPPAYRRLGPTARAALSVRALVERLTFGYVAPSFPVQAERLGAGQAARPLPIARTLVIERSGAESAVASEPLAVGTALRTAERLLSEQRLHLSDAGERWADELERVRETEHRVLGRVLESAVIERVSVPDGWPAPRAAEELWRHLGLQREVSAAA